MEPLLSLIGKSCVVAVSIEPQLSWARYTRPDEESKATEFTHANVVIVATTVEVPAVGLILTSARPSNPNRSPVDASTIRAGKAVPVKSGWERMAPVLLSTVRRFWWKTGPPESNVTKARIR